MKTIRKISIISLLGMMMTGCFHANPHQVSKPEVSSETVSSSETPSSSTPSSSSSSSYSRNPDDVLVESIKLGNTSYSMNINKTITVVSTVLPNNATNKTLEWSSSNGEVATVDELGKVHSLTPGQTTIKAMATDGSGIFAEALVTVNAIEVTSIALTKQTLNVHEGEKFYIGYSIYPSNASYKQIEYTISDETVLKVDDNGQFTAIGPGYSTVKLQTTNPEVNATCVVNVKDLVVSGFEFKDDEVSLHVGEVHTLEPNYYPRSASIVPTTYTSSNSEVATVDNNGMVTAKKKGTATITARLNRGGYSDTIQISVTDNSVLNKTILNYSYFNKFENSAYQHSNSATIGDVKYLVIPTWFTDSTNYVAESYKENVRSDITNAFIGTNSSVGWRSVKTFYEEESFGKLHLDATVTNWYNCGYSTSQIDSSADSRTIASRALDWYQQEYNQTDLKEFDHDRNGVIDAVILIYAAPTNGSSLWAYCSFSSINRADVDDNPNLGTFMWGSYAFMYSSSRLRERAGTNTQGSGDTSHCKIDTHTFIHETGHLLGADDYYDYSGQYSPAGSYTMQDYDWGMHDPFTNMAYGWSDPYVPKDSITLEIGSFEQTGDVVILSPSWNADNSPFDEYIAIEYFTFSGLNQFDATYGHRGIRVTKNGCRVWHVDARLAYTTNYSFSPAQLTTNPEIPGYKVEFAMSNTYYGDGSNRISVLGMNYSEYNLLQLIRNYDGLDHHQRWSASENDFYLAGSKFKMDGNREYRQFVNNGKLNSNLELGWEVEFLEQTSTSAKLKITKI